MIWVSPGAEREISTDLSVLRSRALSNYKIRKIAVHHRLQDIIKIIFPAGGTPHLTFSHKHSQAWFFCLYFCDTHTHTHTLVHSLFHSLLRTCSLSPAGIHLLFICILKKSWSPYNLGFPSVRLSPAVLLSFRSAGSTGLVVSTYHHLLSFLIHLYSWNALFCWVMVSPGTTSGCDVCRSNSGDENWIS